MHNEARRFIMFIDQLYERQTRFLCTANAKPMHLFTEMKMEDGVNPGVKDIVENEEKDSERDPFGRELVANMVRVEELASVKELSFAYQRAASRLIEMQSMEYDEKHICYAL